MSESKLLSALAWAERGYRVFPLRTYGKKPIIPEFQHEASTDVGKIFGWWHDPETGKELNYNVGVLTTDMVVVDLDEKEDRNGILNYEQLGGTFETLTVRTPSGGLHLYFNGPDSGLRVGVWPGVDIRSHNGYVIAPGSETSEGVYTLEKDVPMAWCPECIEKELTPPPQERQHRRDDGVEYDTETAIANATVWLEQSAELAVSGQGGNNATYQVAAKLTRDYALTETTAFALMAQHWNERCTPPWAAEELYMIVEHASQYGTAELGKARPEAYFGNVDLTLQTPSPLNTLTFGNAPEAMNIPPRPWLVERLLMLQNVTLLPAAGSAGKSLLSLIIAAHMAVGKNFAGYEVKAPTKVIVYNAEDDLFEQARRLIAICSTYMLDYVEVRKNLMLIDTTLMPIRVAQKANGGLIRSVEQTDLLVKIAKENNVKLIILDPLVEIHSCEEQSNVDMAFVMGAIRQLAREADAAVFVAHHTSKPGTSSRNRSGDPDVSRGASSIVNLARIVLTLFPASDEDRERYGITDVDKYAYVRLDDAKANLHQRSHLSTWFKWLSVAIASGDKVGVLTEADMSSHEKRTAHAMAETFREILLLRGGGSLSLAEAVNYLQSQDPLYNGLPVMALRRTIEKTLSAGIMVEEDTIQFVREAKKDKNGENLLIKLL